MAASSAASRSETHGSNTPAMALPAPEDKHDYVREMFDAIAPRYDLLNSLLSARLHHGWRRTATDLAALRSGDTALDVCTGTGDFAAAQNHELLSEGETHSSPLSSIDAPTLVIHGTADPMFPLEHGEALAAEIPNARLLVLENAGHGIDRADWETIAHAILEHTPTLARAAGP